MTYPHVTQFETLDLRRRLTRDAAEAPARVPNQSGQCRDLARRRRLRRVPPCAADAV